MFFAAPAVLLTLGLLSTLTMFAACVAVGLCSLQKFARHPVAVADLLGRSGRVHLGIIAAGALGILIAWLAELGQHSDVENETAEPA